jgi:hypothetical protein
VKTSDVIVRIEEKFAAYRTSGSSSEYGGAIMWALGLLAMWALYGIMVYHLRKALYWHARARQWVKRPAGARAQSDSSPADQQAAAAPAEELEEICYMMPDTDMEPSD